MSSKNRRSPSRPQLLAEIESLRARLAEAEETVRAIREGDVDAIVVSGSKGEQVFSLTGSEYVYRQIVETMKEAALTVSLEGRILFCNDQFRKLIKELPARIVGRPLTDFVTAEQQDAVTAVLRKTRRRPVKQRLIFQDTGGVPVPAHVSSHILDQPDGSSICIVATDLTELEASTEMLRQLRYQQEALLASEARCKSLAENMPSVLMRYDRDLRVVYLSPLGAQITGVPTEKFVGKTNREVGMPADLCDLWEKAIDEVFRTGQNRDLEFDFPSATGPRSFYLKLAPEFDAGGAVDSVLGISTEITERKQAEQTLRDRENELRLVMNTVPALIAYLDRKFHYRRVNQSYERWFGLSAQEIEGRHVRDVLGRKAWEVVRPHLQRALAGEVVAYEEWMPYRLAEARWVYVTFVPDRDEAGRVRGLVAHVTDVTARKQMEEELRRTNERLRLLLDTLPVGVTIAEDPQCRVISTNLAGARMFEVPGDGNISASAPQPPPHRYFHQGKELQPAEMPMQMAVFGNREVSDMEIEAHLSSGRQWTGLVSAAPLHGPAGEVIGGIAVARDITERKGAEERIQQQNAILGGINRVFEKALTCETEEDLGRTCLAVAEEITGSKFGFLGQINAAGQLDTVAISDPGWKACRMNNSSGRRKPAGSFTIHGIYGRVVQEGKGFFTNEPASHPGRIGLPRGHPPLTGFLGVPFVHEGRTVGMIAVGNRPGGYSAKEQEALEALAPTILEAFLRRRAETALRQSRARWAWVLEKTGIGMWLNELPFGRLNWDEQTKRLFFVAPEAQPTIELFWSRLHPEDREPTRLTVEKAIHDRTLYAIDHRAIHPETGEVRWIRSLGQATYAADGTPTHFDGINYDITERKHAEEALRRAHENLQVQSEELTAANEELQNQSEELATANEELHIQSEELQARSAQLQESSQRLRLALEAGGMGHWEWDLREDSASWCERSYTLLELHPATPATMDNFLQCVHPDDREAVKKLAARMLLEPADFQADFRVIRRPQGFPGEVVWLASRGKVIRDEQGRGTRLIGILYDITQRKQMEEQLRRLNDQLEEEVQAQTEELRHTIDRLQDEVVRRVLAEGKLRRRSQMLEGFFQHTIGPLAFLDRQLNFVRVNEAYARAEGKNAQELVSQSYLTLHPNTEDQAIFLQVVRSKQPYRAHARPFRYPGDPRAVTYWDWQLTPLLDERGQVQFLVFNLEDVTERQKAFQELEQRAHQLQKLTLELAQAEDRERRRLAEILHDDLQQQLAAAKFHLGILSGRVRNDETVQELAGQINQMLKEAIAKSRSLSHELSPAVLYQSDLGETFEWLARQMEAKHGLRVHVEVRGQVSSQVDALKAFLYRSAQELLFNVIKHARVKEARLRLQRVRGRLWLTVSDQGPGFELPTLGRTAGLGLLGIRERVELLGGRMKIRSVKGRGSTFLLAVPEIAAPAVANAPAVPSGTQPAVGQPKPPAGTPAEQRLHVLLVDDHEVMREGLAALLAEQADIEIVGQAGNGREAVDLAQRLQPDVVIMDVAMPVMGGDEATRRIKLDLPGIRVIALSMFEEPEMAERMRRAGAAAYLLKTGPSEDLLATIRGAARP